MKIAKYLSRFLKNRYTFEIVRSDQHANSRFFTAKSPKYLFRDLEMPIFDVPCISKDDWCA